MTWTISIDECGDVGKNGTRFFVIAATIVIRSKNLKNVAKLITNTKGEMKYSNTDKETQFAIMSALSTSNVTIMYIVADKHDFMSKYYEQYGKQLYELVLSDLISIIARKSGVKDVNIMLDRTSIISDLKIKELLSNYTSLNVINSSKYNSSSNKCIQIADFVAGAIWHMYERNEKINFLCIKKRIHRP